MKSNLNHFRTWRLSLNVTRLCGEYNENGLNSAFRSIIQNKAHILGEHLVVSLCPTSLVYSVTHVLIPRDSKLAVFGLIYCSFVTSILFCIS